MVLGASHFCSQNQCIYHNRCTDPKCKDSSPYNNLCEKSDVPLTDTTRKEIDDFIAERNSIKAYENYSNFIINEMNLANNREDVFSHIVFYNYVQFFQPEMKTESQYLSERDYLALSKVIHDYAPELVIVWGVEVGAFLKKKGSDKVYIEGADTNYLFRIPSLSKSLIFLNIYHPCDMYGYFSNNIQNFKTYFSLVINHWKILGQETNKS